MRLVALLAVWVCFVVLAPALLIPVIEATTPGDDLANAAWKWGSEAGVDEFDDDEDYLYGDDLDEELLGRLDDNLVITGRKTAQEVQKQLWERRSEMLRGQMDDVNKEALKAREERARAAEEQQHQKVVEKQPEVESVPKEPVVALTADTFDAALLRHPYVMAEFYAPWCGHCRKLAPELDAAALQLRDNTETLVAKIDCTVEEELCRRLDIRGYPTLKFFRNAKYVMDYELGRTAEELVAFMRKKSAPTTHVLNTEQEVEAFLTAHPTSFIVYASPKSDVLLGVREAASQAIVEDFYFGEVSNAKLIKKLGEQVGTAKVYRSFAPEQPHVVTDLAPSSIIAAVLAHGHPYVDDGPSGWDRVMARKVPIILLFADMEDAGAPSTLAWFTELAKDNIAKFSFLTAGKEFHSRLATLGASGDKIPTIVAVDTETTKSWPFDETKELTRANVDTFLKGIADGTLRPHYTSQTPPGDNDSPVITLVGDTFEELVLNNDKDVVIDFYAPWCGHCKQLAPTWEKLGQHFQNEDGIVVAQIDAAANDNPSVIIKGFPTIYLFPAGDKANPIEYKGLTRNLKDFVSFVEENATNLKRVHAHGHDHDDL